MRKSKGTSQTPGFYNFMIPFNLSLQDFSTSFSFLYLWKIAPSEQVNLKMTPISVLYFPSELVLIFFFSSFSSTAPIISTLRRQYLLGLRWVSCPHSFILFKHVLPPPAPMAAAAAVVTVKRLWNVIWFQPPPPPPPLSLSLTTGEKVDFIPEKQILGKQMRKIRNWKKVGKKTALLTICCYHEVFLAWGSFFPNFWTKQDREKLRPYLESAALN